jgi:hypothetical protein
LREMEMLEFAEIVFKNSVKTLMTNRSPKTQASNCVFMLAHKVQG